MYCLSDKETVNLIRKTFKESFLQLSSEEVEFICKQLGENFGYLIFEKGYKVSVCDLKEKHIVESLLNKQIIYTNGESIFKHNIIKFSDYSEKRDYVMFNFSGEFIRNFINYIITGFEFKAFL